jgi:NAD(P)H-flavin reductase/ferredoxin
MPRITFERDGIEYQCEPDEWLYDVCTEAGASVPFQCKAGACGTCATEVVAGREALGRAGAREIRTLKAAGVDPDRYRLPCLCTAGGDVVFGAPANARETGTGLATRELVVESYRPLNLTVCEVRFRVEGDEEFRYRPGQYMVFSIPGTTGPVRRSYSISTPASEVGHFEVCVRAVAGGHGSNYIHRLRPGSRLVAEGPVGDFVLDEDSDREILMVATGTGMSPIKSMLLHLLESGATRPVRLLFGLRTTEDLFYTDLLRGLKARYPEFRYRITLSAGAPDRWAGARGRVTDHLVEFVGGPERAARTEAYLCGGREMIEDVKRTLAREGVPPNRIFHENFY